MLEFMHRLENHIAFRLAEGANKNDALIGKNIVLLDGTKFKSGDELFCGTCGESMCPIDMELRNT